MTAAGFCISPQLYDTESDPVRAGNFYGKYPMLNKHCASSCNNDIDIDIKMVLPDQSKPFNCKE